MTVEIKFSLNSRERDACTAARYVTYDESVIKCTEHMLCPSDNCFLKKKNRVHKNKFIFLFIFLYTKKIALFDMHNNLLRRYRVKYNEIVYIGRMAEEVVVPINGVIFTTSCTCTEVVYAGSKLARFVEKLPKERI